MSAPSLIDTEKLSEVQLTSEEVQRYARHLIMPEVGLQGQKKLKSASILCIGSGGLGSPIALYLAAAGIGRIGLVDFDVVDASNLQRQILHGHSDLGRRKVDSARDSLLQINPDVQVDVHDTLLRSDNAMEIAAPYDIVIDGTDNFPTRYLSNDLCVLTGKPNIYGSIFRFEGQATVFAPHLGGPCYRCLFPEPPPPGMVPSCAEGGVLGVLPGIIGVIQAIEAIKLIVGLGTPLIGRLLHFDALPLKFREFKLRRDPQCPVCGDNPTVKELIDYDQFCGISPSEGEAKETAQQSAIPTLNVHELQEKLAQSKIPVLLDVREDAELNICKLPHTHHIPLGQIEQRAGELSPESEIVVFCRSGARSATAIKKLKKKGFHHLTNLEGGILAWADEIDPSMAKY